MGVALRKLLNAAKLLISVKLIILISALPAFAAPRADHHDGNAAAGSATITFAFNPTSLAVCNDDTTDDFWIDFTDGVAAATDDSTNIRIKKLTCVTFTFADPNVLNEFEVGIIAAANTPAYRMYGVR